jgi:hypothetical protein
MHDDPHCRILAFRNCVTRLDLGTVGTTPERDSLDGRDARAFMEFGHAPRLGHTSSAAK